MMFTLYTQNCEVCKEIQKLLDDNNINYKISHDYNYLYYKGYYDLPRLQINDDTFLSANEIKRQIMYLKNLSKR